MLWQSIQALPSIDLPNSDDFTCIKVFYNRTFVLCYIIIWKDNSKNQGTVCGEWVDAIYYIGIKKRIFNMEVLFLCPKDDGNGILPISQEPDRQFSKKLYEPDLNDVSYMIKTPLVF